jgi:hypothetical protein
MSAITVRAPAILIMGAKGVPIYRRRISAQVFMFLIILIIIIPGTVTYPVPLNTSWVASPIVHPIQVFLRVDSCVVWG